MSSDRRPPRHVLGYRCFGCMREHDFKPLYDCPHCGSNLDLVYDYPLLKKKVSRKSFETEPKRSLWRYSALLPLSPALPHLTPHVGWTPLYASRRLGRKLGLPRLFLKDDGRNATASLKDRASAVVLMRAQALGEKTVCAASTGNAAASLACLAAGTGLRTVLFVPQSTPEAKLAQLMIFGAEVLAVDGTYDDAFALSLKASSEFGWHNRNTGYNPFTREGKKTAAYELCEQLDWQAPDLVFVPVADGNILSGLWKGFKDLHALGLIDNLPKLAAVQVQGADSIQRAFDGDGTVTPASGQTIADSMSVRRPKDAEAALAALRQSIGDAYVVTDEEVLEAMRVLAKEEGLFAEPAGAAAMAGLLKAAKLGKLDSTERIAVLVTGSGLKDSRSALKAAGRPARVSTLAELKRHVRKAGL
ncbi:MAG: threonine synthase [Elusimicrobiota bacterium]